jgi:hypothetical protein
MKKVLTVVEAGRLGGLAGRGASQSRSVQMRRYWAQVRAGKIKHRGRGKNKPKQGELPLESSSA